MSQNKYLSDSEILDLLHPFAEQVKLDIKMISLSAISEFYHDYKPLHGYQRTFGFYNMVEPNMRCEEKKEKNSIILNFTYSAFDVNVSGGGDSDWAFDAGFINGFHGGPYNMGNKTYSWDPVPKMSTSPWDIIEKYVNKKYK